MISIKLYGSDVTIISNNINLNSKAELSELGNNGLLFEKVAVLSGAFNIAYISSCKKIIFKDSFKIRGLEAPEVTFEASASGEISYLRSEKININLPNCIYKFEGEGVPQLVHSGNYYDLENKEYTTEDLYLIGDKGIDYTISHNE
ncbi:MAG: hypothetical protein K0Q51_887 [Rickettsiaceae bacterium]|jgi:hypothetical protein|nr:hypothetical protein [Rickettsiaceae bacterium]